MTLRDRLLELTELYQLSGVGDLVRAFAQRELLDVPSEPAPVEPPAAELTDLLQQIARRGFALELVPSLLAQFEGRPLERGAVAWDILCSAAWPQDEDDLFATLRDAAEAIDVLVETPEARCFDFNRFPSTQLVTKYAASAVVDPIEEAKRSGLGAIDQLRQKGGRAAEVVTSAGIRDGLTSLARLFAHAHLPTLASLYLDYVIRALGHREALQLLCETMLDARAAERIPRDAIVQGETTRDEWIDFSEYLLYRTHEVLGESIKAYALLETNKRNRGPEHTPSPRITIVEGFLAPRFGDRLPSFERVDEIAQHNELWALAWGVRIAACADSSDATSLRPLEVMSEFVARFGHDWRAAYHAFRAASQRHGAAVPWKLAAVRSLAQEVVQLPHDAEAWKSLVILLADDDSVNAIVDEIDEHLHDQSDFS